MKLPRPIGGEALIVTSVTITPLGIKEVAGVVLSKEGDVQVSFLYPNGHPALKGISAEVAEQYRKNIEDLISDYLTLGAVSPEKKQSLPEWAEPVAEDDWTSHLPEQAQEELSDADRVEKIEAEILGPPEWVTASAMSFGSGPEEESGEQ